MERRHFFKSIAGLFIVAKTNPLALDLEPSFYSQRPDSNIPIQPTAFQLHDQLRQLTEMIHRKLLKEITWPTTVVLADNPGESGMLYQYSCGLFLRQSQINSMDDDDIETRYIDPIVTYFINVLAEKQAVRFGRPQLPSYSEYSSTIYDDRLAIRCERALDLRPIPPQFVTRFDILFG